MLMDLHCDIWTDVIVEREKGETDVIRRRHLPRFKEGGQTGGVFAVWNDQPDRPAERLQEGIRAMCMELRDARDFLQVVYRQRDYYEAMDAQKLAVILSVEGMAGIGEDIDAIYDLYQLGFRVAGLTWNEQNALATGTHGDDARGLTEAGKNAVRLLQKLGILVDVAHLNDKSFWDVAAVSTGPIIASHSNARALCGVARNLPDDQIKAIGQSGGLIGVNSFNEFISPALADRTVSRLADHMAHIAELIGVEHLGFGFDFMGYFGQDLKDWVADEEFRNTTGLESIQQAPNLIRELEIRGFTPEDIEKISWENFVGLLPE